MPHLLSWHLSDLAFTTRGRGTGWASVGVGGPLPPQAVLVLPLAQRFSLWPQGPWQRRKGRGELVTKALSPDCCHLLTVWSRTPNCLSSGKACLSKGWGSQCFGLAQTEGSVDETVGDFLLGKWPLSKA